MEVWTKEKMHELLDSSTSAVARAVVAIWERQTTDEMAGGVTRHTNNIGFSKFDAEFLSDMALKIRMAWGAKRNWSPTPRQLAVTRNKIKRYHRQLCEIANAKEQEKVALTPSIEPADASVQSEVEAEQRYHDEENRRDMEQEFNRMRVKFAREIGVDPGAFA